MDKRMETVSLRVSEEEHKCLLILADAEGITMSELIRRLVHDYTEKRRLEWERLAPAFGLQVQPRTTT